MLAAQTKPWIDAPFTIRPVNKRLVDEQAVFILLMEYPLTEEGGDHLMTKACWFVVGAGAFASAILLCMRPQYHRRTYRQHKTTTFYAVAPFPPC